MNRIIIEFRDQDDIEEYFVETTPFIAEGVVVITIPAGADGLPHQHIFPLDRVISISTAEGVS